MVTIIGGSGFIGSRLARLFEEKKVDFQIVDKNISPFFPEKSIQCDVRDFQELKKNLQNSHTVINLAAEHRDDVTPKTLYDEVNVYGAQNVCKACEDLGINKILFTSSVAVYGFAPEGTDESGEILDTDVTWWAYIRKSDGGTKRIYGTKGKGSKER